jgi:hypothetical protein
LSKHDPMYQEGVALFIEFVEKNSVPQNELHRCPCIGCMNVIFKTLPNIYMDLIKNGMMAGYVVWNFHGEKVHMPSIAELINSSRSSLHNGASSSNNNVLASEEHRNDPIIMEYMEDVFPFRCGGRLDELVEDDDGIDDVDRSVAQEAADNYTRLLNEHKKLLYKDAPTDRLTVIMELMALKEKYQLSNEAFTASCVLHKAMFPKDNEYPSSFKDAKNVLKSVGMGYQTFHACEFGCCLFDGPRAGLDSCDVCGSPRYEKKVGMQKPKAKKTVRYFPIIPQLQKLYSSPGIAEKMQWHNKRNVHADKLTHPADGEGWKDFDKAWPEFGEESRNVRLALATDGFSPFGGNAVPYSMWPIILTPYNLSPSSCMKKEFNILTLLVSGPKSPGKCLNVFMRPLMDDLKKLWGEGVVTFDAYRNKTFNMRAAVLWTISDFPGLGMLGGIQTKGYKACPICLDDLDGQHSHNRTYYVGARKDLEDNHPYRKDKKHFNGKKELNISHPVKSGHEVYAEILEAQFPKESLHPRLKTKGGQKKLCWTHKSIFWELPYWTSLKTRHALDVMHIEKNVCDNLLGTLFNLPGKTKDDLKGRQMWEKLGVHKDLWPKTTGRKTFIPYANYTIKPDKRGQVLEKISAIRYPSGYAGSLKNKISLKDKKFLGLKTHDNHVLLQRILPIIIRPYVAPHVATVICELANFFQTLCAREITKTKLETMKKDIILILCKLEMIFPPPFHTIMVHLCKHLPSQVLQTGPVHYTWMFSMERELGYYKKWVRNHRYPEGCISESYINHQCATFINLYLNRRTIVPEVRNMWNISVVNPKVIPSIQIWNTVLEPEEINRAHWHVMRNCEEAYPIMAAFTEDYDAEYPESTDLQHRIKTFCISFKETVSL